METQGIQEEKPDMGASESLEARALKLLENNRRTAVWQGKTYFYTVPSAKRYPFQWFWDSCFHAIVYAKLGKIEWAKEEIRSLFVWQDNDGFIPHVIFWDQRKVSRSITWWHILESRGRLLFFIPFAPKPKTSAQIQPAILAQAVARIFEKDRDVQFLREAVPRLNRYYTWLLEARDPDHDHLVAIIAPFESGLDFSPAFDAALGFRGAPHFPWLGIRARFVTLTNRFRFGYNFDKILARGPFHVEDVLVNSILALNLDTLAKLNAETGDSRSAEKFYAQSREVANALIEKCWDPERALFFNLSGRDERRFPIKTIQSLMPLVIPWLPEEISKTIIERHLLNPKEFWSSYPLPSVAMDEPAFSERSEIDGHMRIWRGTSWVNTNWYLCAALRRLDYVQYAQKLASATKEMLNASGFREHFNPRTGEGYGARDFGWSTLVVDM